MSKAETAGSERQRVWIKDYRSYSGSDLLMAVYIVQTCGLVAEVEYAKKDDVDVLMLFAVNKSAP